KDKQFYQLLDNLFSAPGGSPLALPTMVIPVNAAGGQVTADSQLVQLLDQSLDISIQHGAVIGGVDTDLLAHCLGKVTQALTSTVQTSSVQSGQVVTFLLSNGIKITAPFGEIDKVDTSASSDIESQVRDLFENHIATDHEGSLKGSAGVSVPVVDALFPID